MARGHGRSQRMRKQWSGSQFGEVTLSTTNTSLGLAVISEPAEEATILRLIGEALVVGTPDGTGDDTVVGLGIAVVNENALTVGTTALPGPISDPEHDWLWHAYIPLASSVSTAGSDVAITLNKRVPIQSRAMRKVRPDESLVMMGQLSLGDFATVLVSGGVRALIAVT